MIKVNQSIRYSVTSGICLLLGMTLIALFSSWGLHYSLATVIAFCFVGVFGFTLHCYWTFDVERSFPSFARYVSVIAVNVPLTIVLIGMAHDVAGFSVPKATALAYLILFVWNYLAVKWAVVRGLSGKAQ